jgi:F-type H+-transporting ATPase subunit epsilon
MSGFVLNLFSASQARCFKGVHSFVGEDGSGSFGLLPGHARFMTCLTFGLARFREAGEIWHYLAMPGAVLYFVDNRMDICTRRFVVGDDYEGIAELLNHQLAEEELALRGVKDSLAQLERELMMRLWRTSEDLKRP